MHKTRLVKVQLAVFGVIAALSLAYVGINYTGIQRYSGIGNYTVRAEFADGSGLYPNALVTYRGVRVGIVRSIELSGSGVAAILQLDSDQPVPADTAAEIKSASAIGEQYVDLLPTSEEGPWLGEGSVIALPRTSVPVSAATLVDHVEQLLKAVPHDELDRTLAEGSRALSEQGAATGQILDSVDSLVALAQANRSETQALVHDSEQVLDTGNAAAGQLSSAVRDLASFTAQLAGSDPDLRVVLDQGEGFADTVGSTLTDLSAPVPLLLANLQTVGQVLRVNVPGIRQILAVYPAVTASFNFSVQNQGMQLDGDLFSAQAPLDVKLLDTFAPVTCTEGYQGTQRRDPSDVGDVPANTEGRCTLPQNDPRAVRGSRNLPCVSDPAVRVAEQSRCPGGPPSTWPEMLSRPGDHPPATAPTVPVPVPAPGGGPPPGPQVDGGAAAPAALSGPVPAGVPYDPVTGNFIAPDGETYRVPVSDTGTPTMEAKTWQALFTQ